MVVQHGIFFDGLIYATLAKNLAGDVGSVFDPRISKFFFAHFHEHPPFAIFLESLFFKLFGTAYFVERVYSFSIFAVVITIISKLWNTLYSAEDKKFVWLPILLFLALPLVFWSFTQNMLETTMTMFSLLSVYLIYKAILSESLKIQVLFLLFAALSIIASFFSKGPVGIFPLATISIAFIFLREVSLKKAIILNFVLFFFVFITTLILMQNDDLYHATRTYLNQQVIASLEGHRDTVQNRFVFLFEILKETSPLIIITILTYIFTRKSVTQELNSLRLALFFIAIGLSASLPIMVSTKQFGFYLVPSLPFFSLGFSILSFPYIKYLVNKIQNPKYPILFFSLVFTVSLIFTFTKIGEYSRDEQRIKDLKTISSVIQPDTIIQISPRMSDDASLNAYFMRYYGIELDTKNQYRYYMHYKKDAPNKKVLQSYKKMDIDLNLYILYKAKFY